MKQRRRYSFEEAKAAASFTHGPIQNPRSNNALALTGKGGSTISQNAGFGRLNFANSAPAFNRFIKVQDYLQAWELVPVAFSGIDLIASTGAMYDYVVIDQKGKEVFNSYARHGKNNDHPLAKLLRKPNPKQTYYEFVYMLHAHLALAGNFLALKDNINVASGLPGALWPLPIERCLPMFYNGIFSGYGIQMGNTIEDIVFLPPDSVVHIMKPSPYSIYWGIGDIQSLSRPCNIDYLLSEYTAQFFAQGASLSGIVSSRDSLSNEDFERVKREVQTELLGNRNAHKIAVMDNGMSFTALQMALRDAGIDILNEMDTEQILMGLRVPGTKLGLLKYAGYKADEADVTFNEGCMAPRVELAQAGLNKIVAMFDKDGNAVSSDEMQTIVDGTIYSGKSKGLVYEVRLPQKDAIRKALMQATDVSNLRYLSLNEQRKLGQYILGGLIEFETEPDLDTIPVAVDMKAALTNADANEERAAATTTQAKVAVKNANKPTPPPQLPGAGAPFGNPADKGGKNDKGNIGSAQNKNGVNQSKSSQPTVQPSKFNSNKEK